MCNMHLENKRNDGPGTQGKGSDQLCKIGGFSWGPTKASGWTPSMRPTSLESGGVMTHFFRLWHVHLALEEDALSACIERVAARRIRAITFLVTPTG